MIAARSIRASILILLLFQVAALFAREFARLNLGPHGITETVAKDLSYLVVPVVLCVLMWPILIQHESHLRYVFRREALTTRTVAIGVLAGLLLQACWWAQAVLVMGNDLPVLRICSGAAEEVVLGVAVMVALTPLIEEVVHRGMLASALLRFGAWQAVLVSSLFFAVMHSPSGWLFAFVAGVLLALQYLRTGALWLSLVTHTTYNGLVQVDRFCMV